MGNWSAASGLSVLDKISLNQFVITHLDQFRDNESGIRCFSGFRQFGKPFENLKVLRAFEGLTVLSSSKDFCRKDGMPYDR